MFHSCYNCSVDFRSQFYISQSCMIQLLSFFHIIDLVEISLAVQYMYLLCVVGVRVSPPSGGLTLLLSCLVQ